MDQKHFYDDYWTKLGGGGGWHCDPRLKFLLDENISEHFSVLDAGCGDGRHYGQALSKKVSRYLGLDISSAAVERAKQAGMNAEAQNFDAPFQKTPAFDAALAFEVMEHLFNPEILLGSLRESLKPGGKMLVSVPNLAYWRWRLRLMFGRFSPLGSPDTAWTSPWRDPHIRFFTPEILTNLLHACGFVNVKIHGLGPTAMSSLSPALFGKHIAAVAEKK